MNLAEAIANAYAADDAFHAHGAIRTAIIYLESKSEASRAHGLEVLKTAIKVLDANEKARVAAIFPQAPKAYERPRVDRTI